jgi:Lipase
VSNEDNRLHLADLNPIEIKSAADYNPMSDIIFLLFTRANPLIGQRITFDMNTVVNSNWNSANNVRFILHGWTGSAESEHNIFLTREFLRIADHNVVGVLQKKFIYY